ncbi:MAG: DUF222 domain-containing protein [Acidimicrobiales bacterium]|nr:HNH endonuclease [Acidimicrobiia bacterium]NNC81771.1 DUF222 domain-containing protein [Acidimicrobiales bacterium]RZV42309.1 MAG: HNH endonuclease [Acidimicrobiales bacterium]
MAIGGVLEPGADVATLEAAVDACAETPVSCLSAQELSDRLVSLTATQAKLDAVRMETLRAADAANVGALNDQRNTANHVAARTHSDPSEIRAASRIANWLADFDELSEAHRNGQITTGHLDKLRLADNPRVHQQMIRDQVKLLGWMTPCHFRDLDEVIAKWLQGADPDGAEPAAHDPYTGLTITPLPGGMAKVTGLLDPVQAAALSDDIAAESKKLRAAEQAAGTTSSIRKRTLNAVLNLVGRGAARPDGTFARPRVNFVMSQRVYEDTLAWLEDPTVNPFPEIDHTHIDKKCQLIDGTPIHPLYAIAATVTGTFRRIVYSARGRPIEASFDSRQIPDWMRDISLIASNGKCANPVCDSPFHWLHGDHITPYSHTQDTSVANTRDLCEMDNGWRGNDVTRGVWPASIDWTDADEPDEFDPDEEQIADEVALARARVRKIFNSAA